MPAEAFCRVANLLPKARLLVTHDRSNIAGDVFYFLVSGLAKLLFPNPTMPVSDEHLEWMVRLPLILASARSVIQD
jgi:hypothetical protein